MTSTISSSQTNNESDHTRTPDSHPSGTTTETPDREQGHVLAPQVNAVRIDRWLWAARFFKTRSAAKAAIEGGKVHADGARVKPAKDVRIGQKLNIRRGHSEVTVVIVALADKRGNASIAQTLYEETPASIEARETNAARRRMERAGLQVPSVKPSKKGRRDLRKLKHQPLDDFVGTDVREAEAPNGEDQP